MSDYRMQEAGEGPEQRWRTPGAGRWAVAGIVCGVLALLVPVPFGPAGIILGIVGRVKGAGTIATVAIVVSIFVMVISFVGNLLLMSLPGVIAGGA